MSIYEVIYNGLTMNASSPFIIDTQEGVAGLPIRISKDNLTGVDGGVIYKTLYGSRTITLEGTIKASNEVEYFENRRELLRAFSRDGLSHTLSVKMWDGNTYSIQAVVTQTPQILDKYYNVTYNRFRVELEAPDPYWLDGTSEEHTAIVISAGAGFPIPGPLLMPLGENPTGSTIVINNTGDGEVTPTFRLDGSITDAVVTNVTTGESFSVTTNIPNGRYVLLYKEAGDDYVLLDGETSYYEFFEGIIFNIVPGNNTIVLTASLAGVNALLTINYQNRRRGI